MPNPFAILLACHLPLPGLCSSAHQDILPCLYQTYPRGCLSTLACSLPCPLGLLRPDIQSTLRGALNREAMGHGLKGQPLYIRGSPNHGRAKEVPRGLSQSPTESWLFSLQAFVPTSRPLPPSTERHLTDACDRPHKCFGPVLFLCRLWEVTGGRKRPH